MLFLGSEPGEQKGSIWLCLLFATGNGCIYVVSVGNWYTGDISGRRYTNRGTSTASQLSEKTSAESDVSSEYTDGFRFHAEL